MSAGRFCRLRQFGQRFGRKKKSAIAVTIRAVPDVGFDVDGMRGLMQKVVVAEVARKSSAAMRALEGLPPESPYLIAYGERVLSPELKAGFSCGKNALGKFKAFVRRVCGYA